MDIYLKTAFAFMACDGEIVKEEIDLIKRFYDEGMFDTTTNVDECLNNLIRLLNDEGSTFLQEYLDEVQQAQLDQHSALRLLRIAVDTIYADKDVKYSEVRFFRALRKRLSVLDDETILTQLNQVENYWLKSEVPSEDIDAIEDDFFNNIDLPKFDIKHIQSKSQE